MPRMGRARPLTALRSWGRGAGGGVVLSATVAGVLTLLALVPEGRRPRRSADDHDTTAPRADDHDCDEDASGERIEALKARNREQMAAARARSRRLQLRRILGTYVAMAEDFRTSDGAARLASATFLELSQVIDAGSEDLPETRAACAFLREVGGLFDAGFEATPKLVDTWCQRFAAALDEGC